MNLKLYGICFKLRGGPDLLEYVLKDRPVPVDMMGQIMNQIGSITEEEMAFAAKLDNDWKKVFNEKVPVIMNMTSDGGYDIICTVPDELMDVVHLIHDMENEKIVEEHVAGHLKDVCGIDVDIISVNAEKEDTVKVTISSANGFDLADLSAAPDEPVFEDISAVGDMDIEPLPISPDEASVQKEERSMQEGIPIEEGYPEDEIFSDTDEDAYPESDFPDEEEMYDDDVSPEDIEEIPEDAEGLPEDVPENFEDVSEKADEEISADTAYQEAVKGIYTELVKNIKDKELDERLGLRIGQ